MFPNKHKTKRKQVIYEHPYTRQGRLEGGGGEEKGKKANHKQKTTSISCEEQKYILSV